MKKVIIGAVAVISGLLILSAVQQSDAPVSDVADSKKPDSRVASYKVFSVDVPSSLSLAGESVPLDQPDVRERVDREFLVNTYWQSNGILLIKRSQKYFPVIEPILAQEGIPDDFKYLAVIESGLQNVTSPAGAKGFWQIMKTTGKELNLEVNSNVDERYHLEKATRAACKYLKQSKARFGSWTLAAAAYNAGNAGIANKLEDQKVTSYYDLLLNQETGRYIYRILALKNILENKAAYGFNVASDHKYFNVPTNDILVDYEIDDLAQYALDKGINYKILKIHNPWLLENKLNNASRTQYKIAIPQSGFYN